jgi:hypothetical protein
MHRLRMPLTMIFTLLIALDLVMGFRLFSSGWPKEIHWKSDQMGNAQSYVVPILFTGVDWVVVVAGAALHLLLIYLIKRSWHSPHN